MAVCDLSRLAFVDLETTGLDPAADRIVEIAIITVDGRKALEWSTLVNPRRRLREGSLPPDVDGELIAAAPPFRNIALEVEARLAGRLFIAHNARFDHGFLKAEFARVGVAFEPQVLCTVMLSRKLRAEETRHDLDTVIERHGLPTDVRHRALPDARAIWQFWQALRREHPETLVDDAVTALLAGPVLPAHLDPALVDRLPEEAGVYVLHAEGRPLHVGTAGNLRLHLLNYFRTDRTSAKALAISHRVTDITWRTTRGRLGARLQRAAIASELLPANRKRVSATLWSWRFVPEAFPAVELISLSERDGASNSYGAFDSERKARNALLRLAARDRLCHGLLGITAGKQRDAGGCPVHDRSDTCERRLSRVEHLTRSLVALSPLRVGAWPYGGPIGIRERRYVHVVENWRYLGTASDEREICSILAARPGAFDQRVFRLLSKRLSGLSSKGILDLSPFARQRDALDDCADLPL